MVITGEFVFINYPKTGSNFVREVLGKIYRRRYENLGFFGKITSKWNSRDDSFFRNLELPIINVIYGIRKTGKTPHGGYSQIPAQYRDRRVVSVVRNPYDRLPSIYDFRHWARFPSLPKEVLDRDFPDFPNLDFDVFLKYFEAELNYRWLAGGEPRTEIGRQTVQFIKLFFRDPERILCSIDDRYIESDGFLEDMADVIFLSTEYLNRELNGFLLGNGFLPEEVDFIVNHDRVNVTDKSTSDRNSLWTMDTLNDVEHKERFLLKILKYYGFDYKKPLLET